VAPLGVPAPLARNAGLRKMDGAGGGAGAGAMGRVGRWCGKLPGTGGGGGRGADRGGRSRRGAWASGRLGAVAATQRWTARHAMSRRAARPAGVPWRGGAAAGCNVVRRGAGMGVVRRFSDAEARR